MALGDAMRLAFGTDPKKTGIPVVGLEASGWVGSLLGEAAESMPLAEPPEGFRGTLRPYQIRGLSWMRFLERFGFGLCLADDMGLGKTIQMLALLQLEREQAGQPVPPTLLIAPTSVLANWYHEAKRFTPSLRTHVHHGVERLQGAAFAEMASESDLVVTTYALAYRDVQTFDCVPWHRDCARRGSVHQETPAQSRPRQSARSRDRIARLLRAHQSRIAWASCGRSWDFLNPGYLGSPGQFRTRFAAPIERRRDKEKARKLRSLVQPFILRRLKTDSSVVSDLPEKIESKENCVLTPEQAENVREHSLPHDRQGRIRRGDPATGRGARRAHQAQADLPTTRHRCSRT